MFDAEGIQREQKWNLHLTEFPLGRNMVHHGRSMGIMGGASTSSTKPFHVVCVTAGSCSTEGYDSFDLLLLSHDIATWLEKKALHVVASADGWENRITDPTGFGYFDLNIQRLRRLFVFFAIASNKKLLGWRPSLLLARLQLFSTPPSNP